MLHFSLRDLPACTAREFFQILRYPQWALLATKSYNAHLYDDTTTKVECNYGST